MRARVCMKERKRERESEGTLQSLRGGKPGLCSESEVRTARSLFRGPAARTES